MSRLVYYAAEEARWPNLHAAKLTEQEAEVAVRRLWRFCTSKEGSQQPQPRLGFTSGARYSRAGKFSITLNRDRLNWLLVAHEVAHSWDQIRPAANRRHWHDKHHARLVDRLCRQILQRGWMDGALQGPDRAQKRAQAAQERRAARQAPEARIERRRAQVERLERKIKPLVTRLATARRSLGALERAQAARAKKVTP